MKKHSVMITGHATSLSLEPEFWDQLKHISKRQGVTVSHLIEHIDNTRTTNLSSAIRVYVLNQLTQKVIQDKEAEGNPIKGKNSK